MYFGLQQIIYISCFTNRANVFLPQELAFKGESKDSRVDELGVGFYNKVLPPPELISSLCAIAPVVKTVWSVSIESGEPVLRMRTENEVL